MKWCVEGYLEWQKIGLAEPQSVKAQRDEYRTEMDSTELFLRDVCEMGETKFIRTSHLYKAYDIWARDNHQYRMSSRKFRNEMEKKFSVKKSSHEYYQGVQVEDEDYKPGFTIRNY